MLCDKCRNEAIFFQPYSGRHLCGRHLVLDIEARAKRSIRSHRWMRSGDHIAAVIYGDRKSAALLFFLQKLTADRRDIRLSALPVFEEETGASGKAAARKAAELLKIPCTEMPESGEPVTATGDIITKIALAISLDDIAQGVLGEFLFGDVNRLIHPLPHGWTRIPVICPFITIPSEELDLYWEIVGAGIDLPPVTQRDNILLQDTGALLEAYCRRHPATKYAMLHLAEQLSYGNAAAIVVAASGPGTGEKKTFSPQERPNS